MGADVGRRCRRCNVTRNVMDPPAADRHPAPGGRYRQIPGFRQTKKPPLNPIVGPSGGEVWTLLRLMEWRQIVCRGQVAVGE
jgi:hypothetical protein